MNNPSQRLERYRHIVVEGPIGVGKTSLAQRLATLLGARTVLEDPDDNPFLARFYRDGRRYGLQTQLHFLLQRVQKLRELSQVAQFHVPVVGDFLLDKDPIFARLTLDDESFELYRRVYDQLRPQAPVPDLVVYLQASPDTLVDRVLRRGIPMERDISDAYLRALTEAYSRFFHHYDDAPLMIVNTEHLNPADGDADLSLLMRQIQDMRGRRAFFNRAN